VLAKRQCEFNAHIGRHLRRVLEMLTMSIPLILKVKFYEFSHKAMSIDICKYPGKVDES
jgi:hypothetical protein